MKKPYFLLTGAVLLLSACTWFSPVETVEVWDFDRCISEGGLVVAEPPKCLVGEEEHPLSNTGGILEVPAMHEWSDEAFFDALRALDEPLDFTWDVDIPLVGELGKTAVIHGELVYFFQYPTGEAAQAEKESMESLGQRTDGSFIHWGEEVHYFQKQRVIAVYVGSNAEITELLDRAAQEE